jgi:hypothetical protein
MENIEREKSENLKVFSRTVERDGKEYDMDIVEISSEKRDVSAFFLNKTDEERIGYAVFYKNAGEGIYNMDFANVNELVKAKEELPERLQKSIESIPSLQEGLGIYLEAKDKSFSKYLLNYCFKYFHEEKNVKKVALFNLKLPVFRKPIYEREENVQDKKEKYGVIYHNAGEFRIDTTWIPIEKKDAYSTDGSSLIVNLEKLFEN